MSLTSMSYFQIFICSQNEAKVLDSFKVQKWIQDHFYKGKQIAQSVNSRKLRENLSKKGNSAIPVFATFSKELFLFCKAL